MQLAIFLLIGCASALTTTKKEHQGVLAAVREAVAESDANHDGAMDREEFAAEVRSSKSFRKSVFDALDVDRDGKMDAEPFEALERESVVDDEEPTVAELEKEEEEPLNIKGMTKEQFKAKMSSSEAFRKQVFQSLDRDGDGKMDAEPFEALEKKMPSLEKEEEAEPLNIKGMTKEQFKAKISSSIEFRKQVFQSLDRDGDGKMDAEPFEALEKKMPSLEKEEDEIPLNKKMNKEQFKAKLASSAAFRKQVFDALDLDRDGKMDAEPFEAISKKVPSLEKYAAKPKSALEVARAAVADADTDGDRQMNKEEFKAHMVKSDSFGKTVFEALDLDRDGALDAEPFGPLPAAALKQARAAVAAADANGDHKMDKTEFQRHIAKSDSFRQTVFQALDLDKDGKMDAEPFEALEKKLLSLEKEEEEPLNIKGMTKEQFKAKMSSSEAFRKQVFQSLDRDGDGKMDAEPFEALEKKMPSLDKEEEELAELEKEEMEEADLEEEEEEEMDEEAEDEMDEPSLEKEEPKSALKIAAAAVGKADKDGDKQMSKEEFKVSMVSNQEFRKAVFDALDVDRDGKMDAEPFQALEKNTKAIKQARMAITEADKDGDHQMNKEEFKAEMAKSAAFRAAVFDAMDLDRDGKMDSEPFERIRSA